MTSRDEHSAMSVNMSSVDVEDYIGEGIRVVDELLEVFTERRSKETSEGNRERTTSSNARNTSRKIKDTCRIHVGEGIAMTALSKL